MSSGGSIDLLKHLSETALKKLDGSEEKIQASELWKDKGSVIMVIRRPGCMLCREEAQNLSNIQPKIQEKGFNLVGVVHETLGVEEFKPFFKGEIYLDSERRFYGPNERWMSLTGLVRPSFWRAVISAKINNVQGNLQGEGRLLGGLIVIAAQGKGILFEHKETQFGDRADIQKVMATVEAS